MDDDGALPLEEPGPAPVSSQAGLRRRTAAARVESRRDHLQPPTDVEGQWRRLLEDTLPPEKRGPLEAAWEAAGSDYDRHMLLLEYSSYLRRPEVTEEDMAEQRKALDPLLRGFGLSDADLGEGDPGWPGAACCIGILGAIFLAAGLVYFYHAELDQPHDINWQQ